MKHLISVLFVFSCSLSGLVAQTKAVLQAANGGVTPTEVSYLDNVTSAIQTQLDAKLSSTAAASTYQPLATLLTSLSNLSNSAGVLKNNGSGTLSYQATTSGALAANADKLVEFSSSGTIQATAFLAMSEGSVAPYTQAAPTALYFVPSFGTTGTLATATLTTNRTWTLPNATGTLALTSDLSSYLTSATAASTYEPIIGAGTLAISKLATDPLNASNLTSGTVPTARLGSGTANSATYLRGDNTWQTISSGGVTSITGTANEITVTGTTTPTLSLPSALTFTSKTITGGTFSSPILTTPALGTPTAIVLTNATGSPTGISLTKAQLSSIISDDDPAYIGAAQTFTAAQIISPASAASALTLTGGTVTADLPVLSMTQTWNNAAITFNAIDLNVTSTASLFGINTESMLVRLRKNGTRVASINRDGGFYSASGYSVEGEAGSGGNWRGVASNGEGPGFTYNNLPFAAVGGIPSFRFILRGDVRLGWVPSTSLAYQDADAFFMRDAAATVQMGVDAATTTTQSLKSHDGTGTDKDGAGFNWRGGQSTGTGRGGFVATATSLTSTTGSSANNYSTRSYTSAKPVDLAESTATTFANIAIGSAKIAGAAITCTVHATDGTDYQCLTSQVRVDAVNKAGTVTATLTQTDNTTAASAGTLTATYTAVANANSVDIKCSAVSSLTQTQLRVKWAIVTLNSDDTAAVTAQ